MPGSTRLRRFLLRVALYGGAFFVGLPAVFAYVMTRAPRARISTNPPARYEEVAFLSEGLRLRGWLARASSDHPAAVIVHGLGDTLESYQEHAQLFLERGHTVLLIDLRGHGGSEGSYTTLGGREREDVIAAMSYLKAEGLGENGFVLEGHSMGAVAVILAAAEREDVRGVIAEAPFDSFRNTVTHHAKLLFGLPRWVPVIPLAIWGAERFGAFDADAIDTVAAASRFEAPLLAIVDGEDRRMPESVVQRIVDAHRGPARLWIAEGVHHVGGIAHPDWKATVLRFLGEILAPTPPHPAASLEAHARERVSREIGPAEELEALCRPYGTSFDSLTSLHHSGELHPLLSGEPELQDRRFQFLLPVHASSSCDG